MKRLRHALRHAFAVDPPGPAEPSPAEREIVERLCGEVVRRQMTMPALLALELSRPLNYLSAQAMHFFQPLAGVLVKPGDWDRFAGFLEKRGSIEHLLLRLEALEAERSGGAVAGTGDSGAASQGTAPGEAAPSAAGRPDDDAPPPADPARLLSDRNEL